MNNYFYDDIQEISPAELKLSSFEEAQVIIGQANCLEDKMMALTYSPEMVEWVQEVIKATKKLVNEAN